MSVCLLHLFVRVTVYHRHIRLSVTFSCHTHNIQPLCLFVTFKCHSHTILPLCLSVYLLYSALTVTLYQRCVYLSFTFNCHSHTIPPLCLSVCLSVTFSCHSHYTNGMSVCLLHLAVTVTLYHRYVCLCVTFRCHSHTIPPLCLSLYYI